MESQGGKIKRWTDKRKASFALSILRGKAAQEAARKHGLTVAEVEDWKEEIPVGSRKYAEIQT